MALKISMSTSLDSLSDEQQIGHLRFFQESIQTQLSLSLKTRIEQMLRDPHTKFINITHGDELVAVAAVSHCLPGGMFESFFENNEVTLALTMAAVCKNWRGQGVYTLINEARFSILNQHGCTQLLTHTQNRCVMRSLMHFIQVEYPNSRRMPLELMPGMYGGNISGNQCISSVDIRDWGNVGVLFNPQDGDSFRLRWKLQ